jgi:hypothetical protein
MQDIMVEHDELVNEPAFAIIYPEMRDYVRKKLKEIKPEYFQE